MSSDNLFTIIAVVLIVGAIVLTGTFESVMAVVEINFTTETLDWGAGSVNSGAASATLDSDAGTVTNGSWNASSGELIFENIGTEDVILDLASSKDADAFIGGTSPSFQWKVAEIESGSCVNITTTSFTDVNTTGDGTRICDQLYFNDSKDDFKVDFKIVIPSDTTLSGEQSVTITATATAIV